MNTLSERAIQAFDAARLCAGASLSMCAGLSFLGRSNVERLRASAGPLPFGPDRLIFVRYIGAGAFGSTVELGDWFSGG